MDQKKELNSINFNKEFEDNDKQNNKYQEKQHIIYKQNHPSKNNIDKNILKMRVAFDFLLHSFEKMQNPINNILNNNELLQGTIYLLFFFGTTTLLLSGLLKN